MCFEKRFAMFEKRSEIIEKEVETLETHSATSEQREGLSSAGETLDEREATPIPIAVSGEREGDWGLRNASEDV